MVILVYYIEKSRLTPSVIESMVSYRVLFGHSPNSRKLIIKPVSQ